MNFHFHKPSHRTYGNFEHCNGLWCPSIKGASNIYIWTNVYTINKEDSKDSNWEEREDIQWLFLNITHEVIHDIIHQLFLFDDWETREKIQNGYDKLAQIIYFFQKYDIVNGSFIV